VESGGDGWWRVSLAAAKGGKPEKNAYIVLWGSPLCSQSLDSPFLARVAADIKGRRGRECIFDLF
jgi:hypothetical protein